MSFWIVIYCFLCLSLSSVLKAVDPSENLCSEDSLSDYYEGISAELLQYCEMLSSKELSNTVCAKAMAKLCETERLHVQTYALYKYCEGYKARCIEKMRANDQGCYEREMGRIKNNFSISRFRKSDAPISPIMFLIPFAKCQGINFAKIIDILPEKFCEELFDYYGRHACKCVKYVSKVLSKDLWDSFEKRVLYQAIKAKNILAVEQILLQNPEIDACELVDEDSSGRSMTLYDAVNELAEKDISYQPIRAMITSFCVFTLPKPAKRL